MSDTTYVHKLPTCSFCEEPAKYDGKTKRGPWAYMCEHHFDQHGVALGTGKGQRLIEGEKPETSVREKREMMALALDRGDFDAAEDIIGDGDPADWFG